jgi:predicted permease
MRFLRYCRLVFWVALRHSVSWAQYIIAVIIIIVGAAVWLTPSFGVTIDPSELVTMVRSPAFVAMILGAIIALRFILAPYWIGAMSMISE